MTSFSVPTFLGKNNRGKKNDNKNEEIYLFFFSLEIRRDDLLEAVARALFSPHLDAIR